MCGTRSTRGLVVGGLINVPSVVILRGMTGYKMNEHDYEKVRKGTNSEFLSAFTKALERVQSMKDRFWEKTRLGEDAYFSREYERLKLAMDELVTFNVILMDRKSEVLGVMEDGE